MKVTTLARRPRFPMPAEHVRIERPADTDALPLGTHLVTPRRTYTHHGIYVGFGRVVHYAGMCHSLRPLPVQEVSVREFACGHPLAYLPQPLARFSGPAAVQRARSRLGEDAYDLLSNNCEHFCTWCLDGHAHSAQVERFLALPGRLVERTLAHLRTAAAQ